MSYFVATLSVVKGVVRRLTSEFSLVSGGRCLLCGGLNIVPPPSAQRGQQTCAVGELLYSSADIAEPRLCVDPFRRDQVQRRGCTHRVALLLQLQGLKCDVHRVSIDSEDLRIVLQGP